MRKYADASPQISGEPPSHEGSRALSDTPSRESSTLTASTAASPRRKITLAPRKSLAPQRWAICTLKPELLA